jgi:hypothetical protein
VSAFPDIDGWLYSDTVNTADGVIFLIQTSAKMRGARIRDGALFIRTRAEGAAILVAAHIPHVARSTLRTHNHAVFSGRGDILSLEELAAEGLEIPSKYANAYMEAEEIAECYTITEIAKERSSAPRVEVHVADSGDEVVLKIEKAKRRMRIRR